MALLTLLAVPSASGGPAPGFLWIREFGTDVGDEIFGIAIGGSDVYVAGATGGELPGQSSAGGFDAFLRKYDSEGIEVWTRQFGSTDRDAARAVALDATGVYVSGEAFDALPGQSNTGDSDAFVRKYDFEGTEVWTRQFGTTGLTEVFAVDSDGMYIYVTGRTTGSLPEQTYAGGFDAFVRKYDREGDEMWTRQFGTSLSRDDVPLGIRVDVTGVYLAGGTNGAFPGETNAGFEDAFLRKYDSEGNEVWTRQFGTSGDDYASSVDADSSGIHIAGTTSGALPGESNAGFYDAFVREYDSDGTEAWTREFGTPDFDEVLAVDVDGAGVYVAGRTGGALPGQSNAGDRDAFVRLYDPAGNEVWTLQFGTPGTDRASGVAAKGPYVVGGASGPLPGQVSEGLLDSFVAKLESAAGPAPCPLTQGFWKNHPAAWPMASMELGATTYSETALMSLLWMPPRGDASLTLAHQLIAAGLNVAAGVEEAPISSVLSAADDLLSDRPGSLPYGVRPSSPEGREMLAAADVLDAYNNRRFTPGCDGAADEKAVATMAEFGEQITPGAERGLDAASATGGSGNVAPPLPGDRSTTLRLGIVSTPAEWTGVASDRPGFIQDSRAERLDDGVELTVKT